MFKYRRRDERKDAHGDHVNHIVQRMNTDDLLAVHLEAELLEEVRLEQDINAHLGGESLRVEPEFMKYEQGQVRLLLQQVRVVGDKNIHLLVERSFFIVEDHRNAFEEV